MKPDTKRPVIGIITASAAQSEQKQILSGIISQLQLLGAEIVIFSNIYNASEYHANTEIENKIYELILSEKIDGFILTAESFLNEELRQYIYNMLVSRTDAPTVVTGAEIAGFECINNDVVSDIEDIVNHLIEVHNFNDIHILTGGSQYETSIERVHGYKKALSSHNIPIDENKIIYGDFWTSSGEALAMEYISGKRPMPQAVVCANDYMAYGLCDTFLKHGVPVPDDITVIGYEYIGERHFHSPILTTYQRNRRAVGAGAVNLLWGRITGTETEPVSLAGYMVYGNTCSCSLDYNLLCNELTTVRREQYYSQLNLVGNFEQQLTLCRSIYDYINVLQQFCYMIRDITAIHLCLYENWCSSDISSASSGISSDTMVYYRVISQENTSDKPVFFSKYELFPDELYAARSGDILYFCPIFFSGKELGYFILQYDKPDGYDMIFRDWIKIASNALAFLRMKNDINTLLQCRNLSAFHDSVTGIYNETGLRNELVRAVSESEADDSVILLIIRTELFSDNSSIDKQELSVRLDMEAAENLKRLSAGKNEFCAKLSDKMYALACAGNYSEKHELLIADKIGILVSQSPVYSANCGTDSFVISCCRSSAAEFSLDDSLSYLIKKINTETEKLSLRLKHQNYSDYARLRNELYRNPQNKWDPQKICCSFRLSCGHFRASYKELFDISFHQDLIRSRISRAKYLLMTTALSIPAIAYKCGYDDDKYFMRQFRRLNDITPNMYRSYAVI